MRPQQLIEFWFAPESAKLWFRSTPQFDRQIRERYQPLWQEAAAGKLAGWEETPSGALALVILLDQFPLNMFRNRLQSFSTEAAARAVARRAIERGFDQQLADKEKAFLYLPFMHSESLEDQERSVALFEAAGLDDNLRWARHHCEIVRRFGRFPHRNAILGRQSSPDEREYLASEGSFHG